MLLGSGTSSEPVGDLINIGGATLSDDLDVSITEPATRAAGDAPQGDPDAAEKQEWLITPLKQGLDITYGKVGEEATTGKVAILKLIDNVSGTDQELAGPSGNQYAVDKDSKWAIYTFKYRTGGTDAYWYGNGAHFFEGQYVPQPLRFGAGSGVASSTTTTVNTTTAPGLHNNQTNKPSDGIATGNYDLLAQYLGMPAHTRLSATVARIKLPFRHRLCRVQAYVLIDPGMLGVTLDGYKKTYEEQRTGIDDPSTTEIHFGNVNVLAGVDDAIDANGHHTLTPKWKEERKVIPHFVGERGSQDKTGTELNSDFLVFMDIDKETFTYPTDDDWAAKKKKYDETYTAKGENVDETEKACKIRKINYKKVPVYDIIARPTYTVIDNVMYDEEGVKNADGTENNDKKREYLSKTNHIDFDLTLSNGLKYSKRFTFDLDANFQTVVYLRIGPESVDYNASGAELWKNTEKRDDWYGVDNQNGNSLSIAGSTWQRAYTLGATANNDGDSNDKVTDGGFYNEETSGEDGTVGQYLKDETWKKYFAQAYEGGEHHGDYFILKKDITINASELPIGFVFTGHLDAQDHTITVEGAGEWSVCNNEVLTKLKIKDNGKYVDVPDLYWMKEIAQARPRTRAISYIPEGTPFPITRATTMPTDIADMRSEGKVILYKENDTYKAFTHETFYKMNSSALFEGLNGIYTTKQETVSNPYSLKPEEWEANVHKEKNDKGTAKEYWVPYKGVTSGWRAEVINTKVKNALMFATDAVVTGNVQNCYEGADATTKVQNRTPEYPKYK